MAQSPYSNGRGGFRTRDLPCLLSDSSRIDLSLESDYAGRADCGVRRRLEPHAGRELQLGRVREQAATFAREPELDFVNARAGEDGFPLRDQCRLVLGVLRQVST